MEKDIICIADLNNRILQQVLDSTIKIGILGSWANSGKEFVEPAIKIKGRVLTKGYFPRWCIRWTNNLTDSWFPKKGLAGYTGKEYPFELIEHLPIVK